jgi:hypothetical protein
MNEVKRPVCSLYFLSLLCLKLFFAPGTLNCSGQILPNFETLLSLCSLLRDNWRRQKRPKSVANKLFQVVLKNRNLCYSESHDKRPGISRGLFLVPE